MPEDGGDEGMSAFDQACDEMLAAIKADDKAGFCEALKAAIDAHETGEEPEEPK